MSSSELSTAGCAALCVELMVVAGDGVAERAELESVLGEFGIARVADQGNAFTGEFGRTRG